MANIATSDTAGKYTNKAANADDLSYDNALAEKLASKKNKTDTQATGSGTDNGGSSGAGIGSGGYSSGGSSSAAATNTTQTTTDTTVTPTTAPASTDVLSTAAPEIQKTSYYDTAPEETNLKSILDAATEQANNRIDYSVQTSENELNRALEDAQQSYQTERNQVSADEQRALDNQVIYNEARGDRGGIGSAQYSAIQNAAAQNRLAINQQQTQLATDTARQIADLRAQGEFDKADQLLTLTQDYLTKLISIEQWGAEYNLSVDQINQAIDQWKAEYEQAAQQYNANYKLNEASLTGMYNGELTYDNAANVVSTLAEYGIAPDVDTLKRLGFTDEQATALSSKMVSSGSGSSGKSLTIQDYYEKEYQKARSAGYSIDEAATVAGDKTTSTYPSSDNTVITLTYNKRAEEAQNSNRKGV